MVPDFRSPNLTTSCRPVWYWAVAFEISSIYTWPYSEHLCRQKRRGESRDIHHRGGRRPPQISFPFQLDTQQAPNKRGIIEFESLKKTLSGPVPFGKAQSLN